MLSLASGACWRQDGLPTLKDGSNGNWGSVWFLLLLTLLMVAAAAACADPEPVEPTVTALAMTDMDATPTSTDAVPTPAVTPVPAVPTSTPLPTPTAAPTSTPVPTSAPRLLVSATAVEPSSTPVPTATAVPTAIPPTRTAVPVVVVAVTPVAVEYLPNREALVSLYNATDGDNWRHNDNWLSNKPIGEWFGVFTNERGRVIRLDIAENGLNGPIPPELGNLTRLTTLYLQHNRLSGPIPPELGNLTNLAILFLRGNQIRGELPPELGNLTSLRQLGLSGNRLSGSIPPELENLPNLTTLWLWDNLFSGCVPSGLLKAMRNAFSELDLPVCGHHVVTDASTDREALVAIYQAMDGWTTWSERSNWMTDRPIGEWHGVTVDSDGRVTALELRANEMRGIVPAELADLTNLRSLDLSGNRLIGIIPPELGNLTGLQALHLSGNQLLGCIPEGLENVPSNDFPQLGLQFCPVGQLAMAIAIPVRSGESAEDRAALTALFNAAGGAGWKNNGNWLTDEPIWEWYGVSANANGRVTSLVLFENGLAGAIPPELGELASLGLLVLSGNELTGSIPAELGDPRNLQAIYLYGNDLTGCIPSALQHISNNDLEELGLPFCGPEQAGTTAGNRLQQVKDRGKVICAGRIDIPGLGYLDQSGNNVGVEADLCRAVATGVLGDPNAIEIRSMTAAEREAAIASGEVDVSMRLPGWASSRDVQMGNLVQAMLYDGQGFVVSRESGISSELDLQGARVCVTHASSAALNLQEFSDQNDLDIEPLSFEDTATVLLAYEHGQCDAATANRLHLAALLGSALSNPGAHLILPNTITEEALGPVVPPGDDLWFDVVKTVMSILIYAEAYGVDSGSVPSAVTGDARVDRLFGLLGSFGAVAQHVIRAVGNYGEIYDRNLGAGSIDLPRENSLNALWADAPCTACPKGGQIYAEPLW